MRASAWACLGVVGLLLGAACGGAAFTASSNDGGTSRDGAGGSSGGSGSGGGSGSSSGSSSGSASGGSLDGGAAADGAGIEGGPACGTTPTRCGSMTCNGTGGQQGDVCCINASGGVTPSFACAACSCGCETQLECARSAECPLAQVCCATAAPCGAGSTHFVAKCQDRASCTAASGKVLCNPGGVTSPECGVGTCSPDTSNVGIPADAGYGACK
jgi:hypothetical protein